MEDVINFPHFPFSVIWVTLVLCDTVLISGPCCFDILQQFQKKLSKLEEQLSNELQAKDELEQKYRWDCLNTFGVLINKSYYSFSFWMAKSIIIHFEDTQTCKEINDWLISYCNSSDYWCGVCFWLVGVFWLVGGWFWFFFLCVSLVCFFFAWLVWVFNLTLHKNLCTVLAFSSDCQK